MSNSPRQHHNNEFGKAGERWALEELERLGHSVVPYGGSRGFDLLVDGKASVEVKAATKGKKGRRHTTRWQANLSRHGKKFDEDLLLLLCYNGDSEPLGAFVIPGSEIRTDLTSISISSPDPAKYRGQWAKFWNAWEQVDQILDGIEGLYSDEDDEIPF